MQPSTSGVYQSDPGKKKLPLSLKCKPDDKRVRWVEKKKGSLSPDHQPPTRKSKWIVVNREREADLHHCQQQFVEERGEQLWDDDNDEDLQACFCEHAHQMSSRKITGDRSTTYYPLLDHQCSLSKNITDAFQDIYQDQGQSFKVNLSLSYILWNQETDELNFYYASRNNQLLSSPHLVQNQKNWMICWKK